MIRAILSVAAAAVLAGCMTTESSPAGRAMASDSNPSGSEAARLTVTVQAGTKASPVDTPIVRIEWAHQDSVELGSVAVQKDGNGYSTFGILDIPATQALMKCQGTGFVIQKVKCKDSVKVVTTASPLHATNWAYDSTWVYCK